MNKKELIESRKRVDQIMKDIHKSSKHFDKTYKEIMDALHS